MNKKIFKTLLLGLAIAGTTACTADYEEYNTNPTDATRDEMGRDGFNVAADLVNMESCVIPSNTHKFQYIEALMGGPYGGYIVDANPGFFSKCFASYAPQPSWYRWPFEEITPVLYPAYAGVKTNSTDPVILAVADVIKVATIQRLTDWYGPIPYTKVLENNLTTPYDTQKVVYETMFDELDAAIDVLAQHSTETFNPKADRVYEGKVEKWCKFANTLKLRMALRVAYADEALGRREAEEVMSNAIGTLSSNADNATFRLSSKSPLRQIMIEYQGGGDSRVSADITSYMLSYEDPRLSAYFVPSTFTPADGVSVENNYFGLRGGIKIGDMKQAQRYANINIDSFDGQLVWMNAAEASFLKAEAALRGWISGNAQAYYEEGIRLSFGQYNVTGADTYLANSSLSPQAYVDPLDQYSYSGTTSGITIAWEDGDIEKSLERIITQKWIANFPNGNEAWAEFRRTGYPVLMNVVINNSTVVDINKKARRIAYPQSEYLNNYENLSKILPTLGGPDNMATNVWWDCKNK